MVINIYVQDSAFDYNTSNVFTFNLNKNHLSCFTTTDMLTQNIFLHAHNIYTVKPIKCTSFVQAKQIMYNAAIPILVLLSIHKDDTWQCSLKIEVISLIHVSDCLLQCTIILLLSIQFILSIHPLCNITTFPQLQRQLNSIDSLYLQCNHCDVVMLCLITRFYQSSHPEEKNNINYILSCSIVCIFNLCANKHPNDSEIYIYINFWLMSRSYLIEKLDCHKVP